MNEIFYLNGEYWDHMMEIVYDSHLQVSDCNTWQDATSMLLMGGEL